MCYSHVCCLLSYVKESIGHIFVAKKKRYIGTTIFVKIDLDIVLVGVSVKRLMME